MLRRRSWGLSKRAAAKRAFRPDQSRGGDHLDQVHTVKCFLFGAWHFKHQEPGVLYFKHLAKPTNTVSTPIHPGSSPSLGRVRQTRMGRLPAIPSSTSRKTQRGREWSTQRGERWKKSLYRVFSQARCTASELSLTTNTVPASPVPPWTSPPSPRWRCRGLRATWLREPPPPSPFS